MAVRVVLSIHFSETSAFVHCNLDVRVVLSILFPKTRAHARRRGEGGRTARGAGAAAMDHLHQSVMQRRASARLLDKNEACSCPRRT